ncbi:hypothetical protein SISNIDRAFT_463310 [Sistotremastrum niveocremeum HHB9708]|uniref:Uncharacterized protein n=1 Tax=Sistotremastrum niveocremeum HHB9708 TaxID=1314777 RepID=A0A164Z064_9AGAM|nr:hypothetical protein SISNIDRAFT_463310 [Sistotremastrum niveocremeum HHB9708]
MITFPPEIFGGIAKSLVEYEVTATELVTLTLDRQIRDGITKRRTHLSTLFTLSLVSKTWRAEVTPLIWSDLSLNLARAPLVWTYFPEVTERAANILQLLKNPNSSYGIYVRTLCVDLRSIRPSAQDLESLELLNAHVEEILSLTPRLRTLSLSFYGKKSSILPKLMTLQFPDLECLHLETRELSELDAQQQLLSRFVTRQAGLRRMSMVRYGSRNEDLLSAPHPDQLAHVTHFEGHVGELRLLKACTNLKSIRHWSPEKPMLLSDQDDFVSRLDLLECSFQNVTHLGISLSIFRTKTTISLDAQVLKVLVKTFPSLQHLEGLSLDQRSVAMLRSAQEDFAWRLPNLQYLGLFERSREGITQFGNIELPTLSNASIETAFCSFRQLFPQVRPQLRLAELKKTESTDRSGGRFRPYHGMDPGRGLQGSFINKAGSDRHHSALSVEIFLLKESRLLGRDQVWTGQESVIRSSRSSAAAIKPAYEPQQIIGLSRSKFLHTGKLHTVVVVARLRRCGKNNARMRVVYWKSARGLLSTLHEAWSLPTAELFSLILHPNHWQVQPLAAEICGYIAKSLVDSEPVPEMMRLDMQISIAIQCRRAHLNTLLTLSVVSKTWRAEVIPFIWSDLVLSMGWKNSNTTTAAASERIVNIARLLKTNPGYATYVKTILVDIQPYTLGPRIPEEVDPTVTFHVAEILSLTPRLRWLCLDIDASVIPLLPELLKLNLHNIVYVHLEFHNLAEMDARHHLLSRFITRLTKVRHLSVSTRGTGNAYWVSAPHPNRLTEVRRFEGHIAGLRLLGACPKLKSVQCWLSNDPGLAWSQDEFIRELSRNSVAFENVTHLIIHVRPVSDEPDITLDAEVLESLARTFPSLRVLEGLRLTQRSVDFLQTAPEIFAWHLSKLQQLSLCETSTEGEMDLADIRVPSLSDAAIEAAFCIFPGQVEKD